MSVFSSVGAVRSGQHVCQTYDGDQGLREATCDFVRTGLAAGDVVVYVTGSDEATVVSYLTDAGIAAEDAVRTGQLQLVPLGAITPDADGSRTAALAAELVPILTAYESGGDASLRVCSEISALVGDESLEAMIEREQLAGELSVSLPMIVMCLYDRRLLEEDRRSRVEELHHAVVVRGDADEVLYDDPILSITRRPDGGLRVAGEVDISNGTRLGDVLGTALADDTDRELRVDLADLGFIDVAGLRHIVGAARRHPHRQLVMEAPSADLRRLLNLSGWSSEPSIVVEVGGADR
jgi:anti-anti-sigma factor